MLCSRTRKPACCWRGIRSGGMNSALLARWQGNQRQIRARAAPDAALPSGWAHAAVQRVIPNLLAVRAGVLDLGLIGDGAACIALLQRIGRLIGRPFKPPLPVYLSVRAAPEGGAGGDPGLGVFAPLFEPRDFSKLHRRALAFLAEAAETLTPERIDALLANSAGGLLVVPAAAPERRAQLPAFATRCLHWGWLPLLVRASDAAAGSALASAGNERVARIIHELFLENAWTRGQGPGASPALRPWRRLEETYRNANRSQAEHIACKLARGGLIATREVSMADGSLEPLWSRADFIEPLARMEHDRWSSDRLLDGWVFAPRRDNAARQHPDLIPYDALSEDVREKDRVAVATIPFILQLAGLGWRSLLPVAMTGTWPDPRAGQWRRRWRADLARVAEERAPAQLEFLVDPAQPQQCAAGMAFARGGFPVAVRLPAAGDLPEGTAAEALIGCLGLCRRVLWDDAPDTSADVAARPDTHLALWAQRGGLRVERGPLETA